MISMIPWRMVVVALVAAAVLIFVGVSAYTAGSDSVRAEWEAAKAEQALAVAKELGRQKAEFEMKLALSQAIGVDTAAEAERVRVVTRTIVKKVPVYVPTDTPALPAGFGVLHDAAARGVAAPDDPAAAIRAYGPGPSAQDAAETVAGNYGTYHEVAGRLAGLQRYVRDVCLAPR